MWCGPWPPLGAPRDTPACCGDVAAVALDVAAAAAAAAGSASWVWSRSRARSRNHRQILGPTQMLVSLGSCPVLATATPWLPLSNVLCVLVVLVLRHWERKSRNGNHRDNILGARGTDFGMGWLLPPPPAVQLSELREDVLAKSDVIARPASLCSHLNTR